MKDIECCKFADLNLGDSFFDSLKASYPEFEDWFHRKAVAGETAYVYERLIENVGLDATAYWGFMPISNEQFNTIIKLGGANERYFIH